jgi:hypothetical protein
MECHRWVASEVLLALGVSPSLRRQVHGNARRVMWRPGGRLPREVGFLCLDLREVGMSRKRSLTMPRCPPNAGASLCVRGDARKCTPVAPASIVRPWCQSPRASGHTVRVYLDSTEVPWGSRRCPGHPQRPGHPHVAAGYRKPAIHPEGLVEMMARPAGRTFREPCRRADTSSSGPGSTRPEGIGSVPSARGAPPFPHAEMRRPSGQVEARRARLGSMRARHVTGGSSRRTFRTPRRPSWVET